MLDIVFVGNVGKLYPAGLFNISVTLLDELDVSIRLPDESR